MAAVTGGCESFYQEQADHAAYRIIAERQEESLGQAADVKLPADHAGKSGGGSDLYNKNPNTTNQLPPGYEQKVQAVTPAGDGIAIPPSSAATQPTTQASTEPASQPMAQNPELLLRKIPGLKISVDMPPLPKFPKPLPPGMIRQVFTLDDCFAYALAHSREYKSKKEDLYLTALDVTLARHQFEPRLFASTGTGVTRAGETSDYATALSVTQSAGVKQKLPYGGEIVAQVLASNVNAIQDSVDSGNSVEGILSASIPLLRGAGMVAQEDLIQAERNMIYKVRDFERYRRAFLVSVAATYFDLVNQRAQIINRFRSVNSYIFVTQKSQAIFQAGLKGYNLLTVQRAQQSEYSARNDLINAIASYESNLDNFKIMLGMPIEQPLDVAVQYLAIAPPDISDEVAIDIAMHLRLDLQTVKDRVVDAQRQVKLAQNNLLPDLNLTASADAPSGNGVTGRNPWSASPRPGDVNYSAGVVLDWPLDRVKERNSYRTSLINLERAKRAVESSQDELAQDVRDAIRSVRQQQVLLAIQKINIDLAVKRKDYADLQMIYGKIDNRDYLDAEQALLDAQNRFAQALANLQKNTLQYLRDTDQLRVDRRGRLQMPAADEVRGGAATTATRPTAPASRNAPATQEIPNPPGAKQLPADMPRE